ncbi:hypothetical protein [Dysgonomonas massiliensis]|uniref:hypothetical protein n=1 Tax=Dysgonomonas massiliensis TaxID=2040292 RepID=UPI001C887903|nr:hypothetical protein [Dysgonomonas massiliensis]
MKLKSKIENVENFDYISNYAIQSNNVFSLNNPLDCFKIEDAQSVQSFKNMILVLDSLNKPYFIQDGKIDRSLYDSFSISTIKFPYIMFYKKTSPRAYGIYNVELDQVLFETHEWLGRDIFGKYIFGEYQNIITSRSLLSGEILWEFDLSTIGDNPHDDNYDTDADWKIKKIIGVADNKIWLALNHHTIISIDVITGELIHRIHDVPGFSSEWLPQAIPLPEATVIDEQNNKLVGFMWEFYWEIDPQSGVVFFSDLTDNFKNKEIRNDVQRFVLTDKYIHFASHFASKMASLDRATKEIVWQYEFQNNDDGLEPRIMNIQGNDNMLGALSSKGTLYMFEKAII